MGRVDTKVRLDLLVYRGTTDHKEHKVPSDPWALLATTEPMVHKDLKDPWDHEATMEPMGHEAQREMRARTEPMGQQGREAHLERTEPMERRDPRDSRVQKDLPSATSLGPLDTMEARVHKAPLAPVDWTPTSETRAYPE